MKNLTIIKYFDYANNKNIFINAYLVNAAVLILIKIIGGILYENIISEIFLINFQNLLYGSLYNVKFNLFLNIKTVGVIGIFLVLHFGVFIKNCIFKYINSKTKIVIFVLPFVGIILYAILVFFLKSSLPFSLLEALLFAALTCPTEFLIRKYEKIKNALPLLSMFIITIISVINIVFAIKELVI